LLALKSVRPSAQDDLELVLAARRGDPVRDRVEQLQADIEQGVAELVEEEYGAGILRPGPLRHAGPSRPGER